MCACMCVAFRGRSKGGGEGVCVGGFVRLFIIFLQHIFTTEGQIKITFHRTTHHTKAYTKCNLNLP